jgi:hypothetical protein
MQNESDKTRPNEARATMPRRRKDPENMTAEEELLSVLDWAKRMQLFNIAAALRRVLTKLKAEAK